MWFCKYNLRRQGNVILKGDRENENREKSILYIFFKYSLQSIKQTLGKT